MKVSITTIPADLRQKYGRGEHVYVITGDSMLGHIDETRMKCPENLK